MEKKEQLDALENICLNWFMEKKKKDLENKGEDLKDNLSSKGRNTETKIDPALRFVKGCTALYGLLLVTLVVYAFLLVFCDNVMHGSCNNACILLIAVLVLATIILVFLWNCLFRIKEAEARDDNAKRNSGKKLPASAFKDTLNEKLSKEFTDKFVEKVIKEYTDNENGDVAKKQQ